MTLLGAVAGVLVPLSIWAADAILTHTFSAGTPIRAEEVNANFAALRDAVNSKADRGTTGGGGGVTSGSRLKLVRLSSADGMSVPYIYDEEASLFYDTTLKIYCAMDSAGSEAAPQLRCQPPAPPDVIYTDAACTQMRGRSKSKLPLPYGPNLPAPERFFAEESGYNASTQQWTSQWYEVTGAGASFTGQLYDRTVSCTNADCRETCVTYNTPGTFTLYDVSPVQESIFAELSVGLL
jgi:hypothetical protein